MRFLITGISGFVGQYLARLLVATGHEVFGLCRQLPVEKLFNVSYIKGDITNVDDKSVDLLKSFQFDGVFHLAALTHPPSSFEAPVSYFETNALGTASFSRAFENRCCFMHCSTPEVYGICPEEEIFETQPMNPMNPYGVSKAAADLYLLERFRNAQLSGFITRAGSHTGAGRPECYSISSDAAQIARIKKGLQDPVIKVGNLSSRRAVIDVRDVVQGYFYLMMSFIDGKIKNGDIFHVADNRAYSMDWYLDLMLNIAKVKAEKVIDPKLIRPIDIPVQVLNSDKIKQVIGWESKIPIEDTLKGLLNYWMERA